MHAGTPVTAAATVTHREAVDIDRPAAVAGLDGDSENRSFLSSDRSRTYLADGFCIIFGAVVTLIIHGYQFGRGNHTVYLLDALRRANPALYPTDWFVNQTLQYHSVFGVTSGWLYEMHLIGPAFLVGYLILAFSMAGAWFGIMRRLGGTRLAFLMSVVMFYISAGGEGLGMYQFLQDSSFLPSNVAAVAMLVSMYFWIAGKYGWAGAMMGLAGLFHLNYAIVGVGLWFAMGGWEWLATRNSPEPRVNIVRNKQFLVGSALVFVPCILNIGLALGATASRSGKMPVSEFVDLYVHLRHPHHYDPSTWPIALWLSFLWPTPFALAFGPIRGRTSAEASAWRQSSRFFVLLCALIIVALIGAGLFYVSETLVQMSLYRFSVFVKLLSCCAAAYFICDSGALPRRYGRLALVVLPVAVGAILAIMLNPTFGEPSKFILKNWAPLVILLAALLVPAVYAWRGEGSSATFVHVMGSVWLLSLVIGMWGRHLGITTPSRMDSDFMDVCRWARNPKNTPIDSIFLVPPDDENFRLYAQRGVVINFKCVPQLSGELPEWRRRLERVLDIPNLLDVPKPYSNTLNYMHQRYASLPASHLFEVAREMNARYIVSDRHFAHTYDDALVFSDPDRDYCVYDVTKQRPSSVAIAE